MIQEHARGTIPQERKGRAMTEDVNIAAELIVACLEAEGIEYMFGMPGEENIRLVAATAGSNIRFIPVHHEQAAAFMAEIYGRLTGRAAVCTATLGPGAINLLLGVPDAQTDSTPLVALSAQVGLNRIYKESHQSVDLVSMFRPVTKWARRSRPAAAASSASGLATTTWRSSRPACWRSARRASPSRFARGGGPWPTASARQVTPMGTPGVLAEPGASTP